MFESTTIIEGRANVVTGDCAAELVLSAHKDLRSAGLSTSAMVNESGEMPRDRRGNYVETYSIFDFKKNVTVGSLKVRKV